MSLANALLEHAWQLTVTKAGDAAVQEANLRRAVSAAYYALFHQINGDAVALIAPNVSSRTNQRIQRWFDHAVTKQICGRFSATKLDQPLRDLVGDVASADLQLVARAFVQLQEARHAADYDLGYVLTPDDAVRFLELAEDAFGAWSKIQGSAEANVFILSLLLWKNWEKDR